MLVCMYKMLTTCLCLAELPVFSCTLLFSSVSAAIFPTIYTYVVPAEILQHPSPPQYVINFFSTVAGYPCNLKQKAS